MSEHDSISSLDIYGGNGTPANRGGVCSGAKKSASARLTNVVQDGDMHADWL